jgi:hypothetical protein
VFVDLRWALSEALIETPVPTRDLWQGETRIPCGRELPGDTPMREKVRPIRRHFD